MKNKGFTLVEIIGVIVLLVAIAFIVYPSVINVINNSKDKAYQSQVNTIIKSARTYVMEKYSGSANDYKIAIKNIKDYGLLSDNDLIDPRNNINMENLCVNVNWNNSINQHEYSIGECVSSNIGNVIYYDPVNNNICNTYEESNSASGTIEGCLKWHVLSENEDGTVNLILDHNILSGIKWYSSSDNSQGPTVAVEALNNAINDTWSASLVRSDSYSHTYDNGTESKTYTVNYSGMKARLPEAGEIADAVGHTTFKEDTSSSYFYFDSKSSSQTVGYGKDKTTSDYDWLYNNLGGTSTDASDDSTCLYYGCTMAQAKSSGDIGYWTSTAVAGYSGNAWRVNYDGYLSDRNVTAADRGVRPVITILPVAISY